MRDLLVCLSVFTGMFHLLNTSLCITPLYDNLPLTFIKQASHVHAYGHTPSLCTLLHARTLQFCHAAMW